MTHGNGARRIPTDRFIVAAERGASISGEEWEPDNLTVDRSIDDVLKNRYDAMCCPTLFSIKTMVSDAGSKQKTCRNHGQLPLPGCGSPLLDSLLLVSIPNVTEGK
jgi:hypothetical protein